MLVLAACGRGEPQREPAAGSAPGSSTPAEPTVTLVGCAPAAHAPRAGTLGGGPRSSRTPLFDRAPPPPAPPKRVTAWTPYAVRDALAPEADALPVAIAVGAELAKRLEQVDLCLTGKTGSVVAMLEVATDGSARCRVGGIGHKPTEDCIASAIADVRVAAPSQPVEIECGFGAGASGPLRVTVDAPGHELVEVTSTELKYRSETHDLGTLAAPKPPAGMTRLVIAEPDVPAAALQRVLVWVADSAAVLVAVRADGGPPVFLAMAPDVRTATTHPHRIALRVDAGMLHACVDATTEPGVSLLQPKPIDAMLQRVLAHCGEACDEVVEIGAGDAHAAKDLIAAVSAVRRAGLDPVLGDAAVCP